MDSKLKRRIKFVKIDEAGRTKFTKICYTAKGIQLEDGYGQVLRGKVFDSEEEARRYAVRMYGYCTNESYDESWVGDKARAGWKKIKDGAKKVGKAIGDAFNGPFRKGDHIVMKGEDGEQFKGTIKGYDMGEQTYEVMLGNAVNEGLQEEVLEMPDRVEELEKMIENLWWDIDDDNHEAVLKLVKCYVELEKLEPGRVDF